jgi:thioredoxin-like negative regulator of GroEL
MRPVSWDRLNKVGPAREEHTQVLHLPQPRVLRRRDLPPRTPSASAPVDTEPSAPALRPAPEEPQPRAGLSFWWLVPAAVVPLAAAAAAVVWFLPRLTPPAASLPSPGPATPEQIAEIGSALHDMRSGLAHWALRRLRSLQEQNPRLAPIDYVMALAAVAAGDAALAASSLEATLAKGQRVSDALALRATLETMQVADGDREAAEAARLRAEAHLRRAIQSDTANPAPFIELAMRLRGRGENSESRQLLEAARARTHPVDPLTVVDTTLLLISLEELPDAELPADLDPDRNTASLIGAAYVALRRGDNPRAAELLRTARARLPEELYRYLLGDPQLRRYASAPGMAPLFE